MNSSNANEKKSNVLRDIIVGIVIVVIGGVILAYIIQDARFKSLPAENSNEQSQSTQPIPISPAITTHPSGNGHAICGVSAFSSGLETTDPLFSRPEGYTSGWVSSDPATVILPDGTTIPFENQFVLIVEGVSKIGSKMRG